MARAHSFSGWIATFVVLAVAAPALARDAGQAMPAPDRAEQWLLTQQLKTGGKTDRPAADIRQDLEQVFDEQDLNGQGITSAVRDALVAGPVAQQRAHRITQQLAPDLDGDGRITRDELRLAFSGRARRYIHVNGVKMKPSPEQVAAQLERLVGEAMQADADNDGVVTIAELLAQAKSKGPLNTYHTSRIVPLDFDADRDGTVTRAEFVAVVDRLMARIDADGNGAIDTGEAGRIREMQREAREAANQIAMQKRREADDEARAQRCNLPEPTRAAKLVVVSATQGSAAADVVWQGAKPEVASVAQVEITAGTEPLYVVAVAREPTIWIVKGETARIERFVVGGGGPSERQRPEAAVLGLDAAKVHLSNAGGCPSAALRAALGERVRLKREVARLAGREPDAVALADHLALARLPEADTLASAAYDNVRQLTAAEPGSALRAVFAERFPAGVVSVAAERLVTNVSVKPGTGLPGEAGIAALVDEGALLVTGYRSVLSLPLARIRPPAAPAAPTPPSAAKGQLPVYGRVPPASDQGSGVLAPDDRRPNEFRILRKLTLPAGLGRQMRYTFLLPDGVPEPDGASADVCVVREKTGEPLTPTPFCRPRR